MTESTLLPNVLSCLVLFRLYCNSFNVLCASLRGVSLKCEDKITTIFYSGKILLLYFPVFNTILTFHDELLEKPNKINSFFWVF